MSEWLCNKCDAPLDPKDRVMSGFEWVVPCSNCGHPNPEISFVDDPEAPRSDITFIVGGVDK